MAAQIEREWREQFTAEAQEAVESAEAEPGVWFGRENAERVAYGNGVFTTACNGDGTDYESDADAVDALVNEWMRDALKGR